VTLTRKSRRASDGLNSRTAHRTSPRSSNPATEAAWARPRTNPECTADQHGSAHSAKHYGCICREALADRDEERERAKLYRRRKRAEEREQRTQEDLQALLAEPVEQLDLNADGLPVRHWPDPIRLTGNIGRRVLRGHERAACIGEDPEQFFPLDEATEVRAKGVCRRCPIQDDCLTWALQEGFEGVFGGTTYEERVAIRRTWKRAG
jgi:WhiB family redox-sensing transcriptional regulator